VDGVQVVVVRFTRDDCGLAPVVFHVTNLTTIAIEVLAVAACEAFRGHVTVELIEALFGDCEGSHSISKIPHSIGLSTASRATEDAAHGLSAGTASPSKGCSVVVAQTTGNFGGLAD
jgi:hypothetical protein